MITYVSWKWKPAFGRYRSDFAASAVNVWASMVDRHAGEPHELVCVTDDPKGIDKRVRVITPQGEWQTLWEQWARIPNPSSPVNPSCYRRLALFHPEAARLFQAEYLVSMDLDVVITGALQPLFARRENFRIWGGQTVQPRAQVLYNWANGSLMALRAGAQPQVYTRFDPRSSPAEAHRAGCRGSDQGWISYVLGKQIAIWGTVDGVYSYRNHILPAGGRLPAGARLVAFHGRHDPWHSDVRAQHNWVRKHYL